MTKIKDIIEFVKLFRGIWKATRAIRAAGKNVREVVVQRAAPQESYTEMYWKQRLFSNKVDRGQS